MAVQLPETALYVKRIYIDTGKQIESEVLEGELPMSQEQQDYYKSIIGDGQARISVGRDLSEMDFGSGGKVFVSVSLVCDQSQAGINAAVGLAAQAADYFIEQHYMQMKGRCQAMNLLKPDNVTNGRPQY